MSGWHGEEFGRIFKVVNLSIVRVADIWAQWEVELLAFAKLWAFEEQVVYSLYGWGPDPPEHCHCQKLAI